MATKDLFKSQCTDHANLPRQQRPAFHKEAFLFIWCLLWYRAEGQESAVTVNCSRPDVRSFYDALEKALQKSNDIRPVRSIDTPTDICVTFTIAGILGVDEKAQLLTTFLWLNIDWKNEFLSWNSTECGVSRISIPRSKLWVPDILINEFMDEDRSPQTAYVYVYNDGTISDDRPVRVVSSCNLDIYNFPFDTQNCSLTFGSYLHVASDIKMILGNDTAKNVLKDSNEAMLTMGEWELIDIRATHDILETSDKLYEQIIFYVVLRRRPTQYVVNLLLPSCFLITVDLFSFLLPPQNVDRASFKMTLILGYTVFLLIMNDLLPVTGNRTPLINVFFSICLALMVASLLETVLITNILYSSSHYPAVPHWIRVLVLKYLARLVGLAQEPRNRITIKISPTAQGVPTGNKLGAASCQPVKVDDKPSMILDPRQTELQTREPTLEELKKLSRDLLAIRLHVDKQFCRNQNAEEWTQIGNVIDRLLFSIYILFISSSFITIIIIWVKWYNL